MLKLYIAVRAEIKRHEQDYHITLCHMSPKETDKLSLNMKFNSFHTYVKDVVYWKDDNVTVALIEPNDDLEQLKFYLQMQGFTYNDHEFIPHITLGRGDLVEHHKQWDIGSPVFVSMKDGIYLKIKELPDACN